MEYEVGKEMNLYIEIEQFLAAHGYTIEDILWVGTKEYRFDLQEFLFQAKQTNYINDWGNTQIREDLIVCGKDFYLTRFEYDGFERFEFHQIPSRPERTALLFGLKTDYISQIYKGQDNRMYKIGQEPKPLVDKEKEFKEWKDWAVYNFKRNNCFDLTSSTFGELYEHSAFSCWIDELEEEESDRFIEELQNELDELKRKTL